jgi:hypothetical protein
MPYWRKAHEPTSRFNSFAIWTITTSAVLATLVLILRRLYI